MKKLLIVCIVALCSCNNKQKEEVKAPITKRNVGEIIFMKPDSTKGYIYKQHKDYNCYSVSYFDKIGEEHSIVIDDLQIY